MAEASESQADFAKRHNVSRKTVTIWKQRGLLVLTDGGKVDVTASNARIEGHRGVTAGNGNSGRRGNAGNTPIEAEPGETLEDAATRLTSVVAPQFETKADAERFKETYIALLRKLEHDEKAGEVVKVADVARIVGGEYSKVRSRLMEIAVTVAPSAALLTSPEAIRDLISKEVSYALQELAFDGSLGPRA